MATSIFFSSPRSSSNRANWAFVMRKAASSAVGSIRAPTFSLGVTRPPSTALTSEIRPANGARCSVSSSARCASDKAILALSSRNLLRSILISDVSSICARLAAVCSAEASDISASSTTEDVATPRRRRSCCRVSAEDRKARWVSAAASSRLATSTPWIASRRSASATDTPARASASAAMNSLGSMRNRNAS